MKVEIIFTDFIKPSCSTPSHLRKFKISFLDQRIPSHFHPLLFYYPYNATSTISQSDMVCRIKRSLSDTLTHFYPLAGRMEGLSSVDCNDNGVKYLEAHIDCQLSCILECPEIEVLNKLIPYNLEGSQIVHAEEQLAVQVNLFTCGGIVLGTCISHRIADICTFSNFLKSWAAIARGESNFARPIFTSSTLFPPGESSDYMVNMKNPAVLSTKEKLVTKRFVFTASTISALKAKVKDSSSMKQPTRVEIVSAFIWKCVSKKGKKSAVSHPVNLRSRMVPPLPGHSFGNIFQMATAVITEGEAFEFGCLIDKLRDGFAKINEDYIRKLMCENGYELAKNNFKQVGGLMSQKEMRMLRLSSWCRFPIYEVDFGWGKPSWVSMASVASKDGLFFLDSRCGGGLEVWVNMIEQDLAEFEQHPDFQMYMSSSK